MLDDMFEGVRVKLSATSSPVRRGANLARLGKNLITSGSFGRESSLDNSVIQQQQLVGERLNLADFRKGLEDKLAKVETQVFDKLARWQEEGEDEDESNASYFTVNQPGVLKLTLQQYVRPKMFSNPADASTFADLMDARHFVLWGEGTDETGGFICVEPWIGGPNSLNTGRGRVALSPGHSFQWAFTLKPEWQGSGI